MFLSKPKLSTILSDLESAAFELEELARNNNEKIEKLTKERDVLEEESKKASIVSSNIFKLFKE